MFLIREKTVGAPGTNVALMSTKLFQSMKLKLIPVFIILILWPLDLASGGQLLLTDVTILKS